ncbi:hypothetical protein TVAGG3_0062890 [Trichomonas vaginalis G3]|nr:hypothetical protein TVAGG3_0062890 [Trichomonas vaginalis G3]KAI5542147.1 hypothetical protein TVAGG3_0062890 [Trichomonas vaginalis G3]
MVDEDDHKFLGEVLVFVIDQMQEIDDQEAAAAFNENFINDEFMESASSLLDDEDEDIRIIAEHFFRLCSGEEEEGLMF